MLPPIGKAISLTPQRVKMIEAVGGHSAIKAYNGAGTAAERYMENVKAFTEYCEEVTGA